MTVQNVTRSFVFNPIVNTNQTFFPQIYCVWATSQIWIEVFLFKGWQKHILGRFYWNRIENQKQNDADSHGNPSLLLFNIILFPDMILFHSTIIMIIFMYKNSAKVTEFCFFHIQTHEDDAMKSQHWTFLSLSSMFPGWRSTFLHLYLFRYIIIIIIEKFPSVHSAKTSHTHS